MAKTCMKENRKIWSFLFLKEKNVYKIKLCIFLKSMEETG